MKQCPVCQNEYPAQFVHCPADGSLLTEIQNPQPAGNSISGAAPYPLMQELEAMRRRQRRRNTVTLAIVAGVVGIPVLLILGLIAIPTIGSLKKHANETAAIQTMQAINKAQVRYEATYPDKGFACSLDVLGGNSNSGSPRADAAQLLPSEVASGVNSGYLFSIDNCTRTSASGQTVVTGYRVTAVPDRPGKTGNRGFCSNDSGALMVDPDGGSNCTAPSE